MSHAQFATDGFGVVAICLVATVLVSLTPLGTRLPQLAKTLAILGASLGFVADLLGLPTGTLRVVLWDLGNRALTWRLDAAALWILAPAWLVVALAIVVRVHLDRWWPLGVALAMLGVVTLAGADNGALLLIGWELMSLGGGVMILATHHGSRQAKATLTMLALLEVGSVALLGAVALLSDHLDVASFATTWASHAVVLQAIIGLLFMVGFGAKLGLVPFSSWFADAYASADGPTGTILSSLVLNAAFFALGRALLRWLPPHSSVTLFLGIVLSVVAMGSAIVAILSAFSQRDWRRLLSLSGAENAQIASAALGAALIFEAGGHQELAGLCWLIGILHLMGHSLAKGALFLTAYVKQLSEHNQRIVSTGLAHRYPRTVGVGGLVAALSLSAMPPTMGFVTEWLLFEVLFHDFVLTSLAGRTALIVVGAGLALSAALSLASFIKLYGVGLLGALRGRQDMVPRRVRLAVVTLAVANLGLAVSLVTWGSFLRQASWPDPASASAFVTGWLIVPLSATFAFISPAKFAIVGVIFALVPVLLVTRRHRAERVPPWSGGETIDLGASATTALGFSNPLRTVYSVFYRPTTSVERRYRDQGYVLEHLDYDTKEAPILGTGLVRAVRHGIRRLARWITPLQSGRLTGYLSYVLILVLLAMLAVFLR